MAVDKCPECGSSFEGLSAEEVKEHRNHWPETIPFPTQNKEAVERAKQVEDAHLDRLTQERQQSAGGGSTRRPS